MKWKHLFPAWNEQNPTGRPGNSGASPTPQAGDHIGMDTVQLEGKYFDAHVKQGDKVKKGDVLVTFDMDAIKNEGYSLVTPVIITNTADYLDVVEVDNGNVSMGDDLLTVLK